MKYGLYAVRDVKTGYLPPQADINDYSAIRNFNHACMDKSSLMFTHGADYELYKIGDYDTECGEIVSLYPGEFLTHGENKEV